jgi:L-alanine-DL-glutamate epimerase-like enolase superfamily enzyme
MEISKVTVVPIDLAEPVLMCVETTSGVRRDAEATRRPTLIGSRASLSFAAANPSPAENLWETEYFLHPKYQVANVPEDRDGQNQVFQEPGFRYTVDPERLNSFATNSCTETAA